MKFTIWKVASSPSSVLYISTDTYRTYLFHQPVYLINALSTTVIIFFSFFPLSFRSRLSPLTSINDNTLTFYFSPFWNFHIFSKIIFLPRYFFSANSMVLRWSMGLLVQTQLFSPIPGQNENKLNLRIRFFLNYTAFISNRR